MSDSLRIGREVIEQEARALEALAKSLGSTFEDAVRLLASTPGRVLVSGVGKSGSIAQKVAGTLASTGTPALFLEERSHGRVGEISQALSESRRQYRFCLRIPGVTGRPVEPGGCADPHGWRSRSAFPCPDHQCRPAVGCGRCSGNEFAGCTRLHCGTVRPFSSGGCVGQKVAGAL